MERERRGQSDGLVAAVEELVYLESSVSQDFPLLPRPLLLPVCGRVARAGVRPPIGGLTNADFRPSEVEHCVEGAAIPRVKPAADLLDVLLRHRLRRQSSGFEGFAFLINQEGFHRRYEAIVVQRPHNPRGRARRARPRPRRLGEPGRGSVYFDARERRRWRDPLQRRASPAPSNVGLGPAVMPNLTIGSSNVAIGDRALHPTRPATSTSPPAPRAEPQHHRRRQRRHRRLRAAQQHAAGTTTSPPAARRCGDNTTGDDNVASGFEALFYNTAATTTSRAAARRCSPTTAATPTSRPVARRCLSNTPRTATSPPAGGAVLEHDRERQRRRRPTRAVREHDRIAQHRARPGRRREPDHRLEQHRHRPLGGRRRVGDDPDRQEHHADRHVHRRDQRHDARRSGPAGGRQVGRQARGRAGRLGVHGIARGDRRAAAAPGRAAARPGEGRLVEGRDCALTSARAAGALVPRDLRVPWAAAAAPRFPCNRAFHPWSESPSLGDQRGGGLHESLRPPLLDTQDAVRKGRSTRGNARFP